MTTTGEGLSNPTYLSSSVVLDLVFDRSRKSKESRKRKALAVRKDCAESL
jgi:hypothetical protein